MRYTFTFLGVLSLFVCFIISCDPQTTVSDTSPEQGNDTTDQVNTESIDTMLTVDEMEDADRAIWQAPDDVINFMKETANGLEDKVVAEIGAGSGYFARRLTKHTKKVIANDIKAKYIDTMEILANKFLSPEELAKFDIRPGLFHHSGLGTEEADIVLFSNVYPYMQDSRVDYLKHLYSRIKPGGYVFLVEFTSRYSSVLPDSDAFTAYSLFLTMFIAWADGVRPFSPSTKKKHLNSQE